MQYRVWDNESNRWMTDEVALLADGSIIIYDSGAGDEGQLVYRTKDSGCFEKGCFDSLLIEYGSGKTDKFGKMIFDGDFVKLSETNPVMFLAVVSKSKYGFVFTFLELDTRQPAGNGYFLHNCEVVGNVHDNPDLLK